MKLFLIASAIVIGVSGAIAYGRRDGFTRNVVTGNDVDSRSAFAGKGQLLWTPSASWETRVIVNGERARDGDYGLNDLAALRANPFEVARDFEGHTDRDLVGTTILARRTGGRINLSTTTGFVNWKTVDETDLDYTPLPDVLPGAQPRRRVTRRRHVIPPDASPTRFVW